jgi:hypothetical protein
MNRPESLNALNAKLVAGLSAAVDPGRRPMKSSQAMPGVSAGSFQRRCPTVPSVTASSEG